jgi:rubrerythrin
MPSDLITALEARRVAEKSQAQFYRSLAADAEASGDRTLSQRLHDLHADEQHHLSRITARILELGGSPGDFPPAASAPAITGWEQEARSREHEEVAAYRALLELPLDETTEALIRQILDSEERHAEDLGGKWMPA